MTASTPQTDSGFRRAWRRLWRRHGGWALLAFASLGAALYIRYGLIQSTPIGLSCQEVDAPWFCGAREGVIQFNMMAGWSWLALLAGGLALVTRWRLAIGLGLVAGAAGLVLYNAGPAGAGFILALSAHFRAAHPRR